MEEQTKIESEWRLLSRLFAQQWRDDCHPIMAALRVISLSNVSGTSRMNDHDSELALSYVVQGHLLQDKLVIWACHNSDSGRFWEYAVNSVRIGSWNRFEIQADLEWQWLNRPWTVLDARRAARGAGVHAKVAAMYHLLDGQRDNPQVIRAYRVCFRDDPQWLFETMLALH